MKAIIINRKLSPEEKSSLDRMVSDGARVIETAQYGITEEEKKKINYEVMDMVLAFGDKDFEGKPLVDWLKFDESSLWYYHKFRAYFRLRNLKYEIAALNKLAQDYDGVHYYSADPFLSNVQFPENVQLIITENSSSRKWNYFSLLKYFLILKSRWMINVFSPGKLKKPDHIIMDVSKRQVFLDIENLKENQGNYVIGYMLEKAGKDFLIIDEAVQPKMTDGAKIRLDRDGLFGKGSLKRRYLGEPILLNYFLSGKLKKRKKQLLSKIQKNLGELHGMCSGDEKLLISIYLSFKGASNFYLIKYLSYKRFFGRNHFKTIATVDENSPALRSILDAARTAGIKTIGMQHGNLHDLHPAYIYTRADAGRNAFPGHNLVWGEFWKAFLMKKGNYPADSMSISGQIRTDIIPKLKAESIEKAGLIPGAGNSDRLIVFASQPQRDAGLRERAALDVMQAVKALPETFLVIKLHPNERNDIDYYQKLAERSGLDKLLITLEIDLYLLISVCDILITCFSTVGTETIYFHKPLIILDHLKQDIQNYHKEGVALQATNMEELKDHLESILNGVSQVDPKAYNKFITKYAFAIDGKAAERALEVIRKL